MNPVVVLPRIPRNAYQLLMRYGSLAHNRHQAYPLQNPRRMNRMAQTTFRRPNLPASDSLLKLLDLCIRHNVVLNGVTVVTENHDRNLSRHQQYLLNSYRRLIVDKRQINQLAAFRNTDVAIVDSLEARLREFILRHLRLRKIENNLWPDTQVIPPPEPHYVEAILYPATYLKPHAQSADDTTFLW